MEPDKLPMSDAEREVMKIFWTHGPLGVREVLARITESGLDWTRSTVVTLLHRLEAKGYLECDKTQYAFTYRPVESREDVIHARIRQLASELSEGDAMPLMLAFAQRHRFSAAELTRLQEMINQLKKRVPRK
jgi:predicted transcriptional regulator